MIEFGDDRLPAKFWRRVSIKNSGCWEWVGPRSRHGNYGRFCVSNRGDTVRAHRHLYLVLIGMNNPENSILHSCDNAPCVNPLHLSEGTQQQNMSDASARGRMRHGEGSYKAKITEDDVVQARTLKSLGARVKDISEAFQISSSQMSRILRGLSWRHLNSATYIWEGNLTLTAKPVRL